MFTPNKGVYGARINHFYYIYSNLCLNCHFKENGKALWKRKKNKTNLFNFSCTNHLQWVSLKNKTSIIVCVMVQHVSHWNHLWWGISKFSETVRHHKCYHALIEFKAVQLDTRNAIKFSYIIITYFSNSTLSWNFHTMTIPFVTIY